MIKKKIVLICGASQTVVNFRKGLINCLRDNDYHISVIAFDDDYREEIIQLGVDYYCINEKNRDVDPLRIIKIKQKIYDIVKNINPEIVLTFMLKPNIFGVLASRKAKVKKIFSMVEGAGDVFINKGFKWLIIRVIVSILYKKSLKCSSKVFFLNNDDKNEFLSRGLLKPEQTLVINGIGVDMSEFSYKPVDTESNHFLMIARMLTTKGIWDYIKCAEIVKMMFPEAQFDYLGAEGTVTVQDIQPYIDKKIINYLGTTKDVRPYIEQCLFFILPSYREGMSMSIMEAESIGRGIITTDNIGCRDSIRNGYNGFLIKQNDYTTMAELCKKILADKTIAIKMGNNSRHFCEDNFEQKTINQKILNEIMGSGS